MQPASSQGKERFTSSPKLLALGLKAEFELGCVNNPTITAQRFGLGFGVCGATFSWGSSCDASRVCAKTDVGFVAKNTTRFQTVLLRAVQRVFSVFRHSSQKQLNAEIQTRNVEFWSSGRKKAIAV